MRSTPSGCRISWSRCPAAKVEQRDRAARALFAATEMVSGNKFETEFGRTIPQTKLAAYNTRYQARFQQLAEQLTQACRQNRSAGDLAKIAAKADLRDPWDTRLRVERRRLGSAAPLLPDAQRRTRQALRYRRRFLDHAGGAHPQNRRPAHLRPDRHRPANRTRPRTLQRPRGDRGFGEGFDRRCGGGRHSYRARSRHRRHADSRHQCRRTVHAGRTGRRGLRDPRVLARLQDRVASRDVSRCAIARCSPPS